MSARKIEPIRYCKHCGVLMQRRRYDNGNLETMDMFIRRQYCDLACYWAYTRAPLYQCKVCAKRLTGKDRRRQKYCGFACMGVDRRFTPTTMCGGYREAHRLYKPEVCSKCCSTEDVQIHHKDRNPINNDISNVEFLCRVCHNIEHKHKKPRPIFTCIVCGSIFMKTYYSYDSKTCSRTCLSVRLRNIRNEQIANGRRKMEKLYV